MSRRSILSLCLMLVLLVALGVKLALDGDQPERGPGPALPELAKAEAGPGDVVVPEPQRVAQEAPPRPVSMPKMPELPVYNAPGKYTLFGEVLDATTLEPVTMFRMACLPAGGDIDRAAQDPMVLRSFNNPIGTFTWRLLDPGYYNLLITVGGYETLVVRGVKVPTSEEKLSLKLSRGAYVTVEVNDSEGFGIDNLEIRLNPVTLDDPAKGAPRVQLRYSDRFGKARFTNLPTGMYSVSLNSVGLTDYQTETFYLGPGAHYPAVFVVPLLNTIHVQAKNPEGVPVSTVQVRMFCKGGKGIFRAETESDGKALIQHVPQGEYTVKVYKRGYRRKNQTLVVSTTTGDVPLEIEIVADPLAEKREEDPTMEEIERLKRGERPSEVFTDPDGRDG